MLYLSKLFQCPTLFMMNMYERVWGIYKRSFYVYRIANKLGSDIRSCRYNEASVRSDKARAGPLLIGLFHLLHPPLPLSLMFERAHRISHRPNFFYCC